MRDEAGSIIGYTALIHNMGDRPSDERKKLW